MYHKYGYNIIHGLPQYTINQGLKKREKVTTPSQGRSEVKGECGVCARACACVCVYDTEDLG